METKYDYTAFIGDVHGSIFEFKEILELINSKHPKTRIICLGDFGDRGIDSYACFQLASELKLESVMGNHEHKYIKWLDNGSDLKSHNYQSYYSQLTDQHIQYIHSMPLYIELEDVIAVHAGIKPNVPMAKQTAQDMMYLRYTDKYRQTISLRKINKFGKQQLGAIFWTSFGSFGKNVVYGHNVHSNTDIKIDTFTDGTACLGIDTGAVFGGRLSTLILPRTDNGHDWARKEIIQVPAKRVYYKSDFSVR